MKQIPMIIQGTWFLLRCYMSTFEAREGAVKSVTHRGLYFACHMNGAEALPIQYADNMIALTVTRLVWPAVTLDTQDSAKTNPVVPIPEIY